MMRAIKQFHFLLLCLLFTASPLLASDRLIGTREAARLQPCNQSKDCPSGLVCALEHIPCASNPTASSCVQKVCSPDPAKKISADAILESGPDDSPGMRLQFVENEQSQTVWTTLHGEDWQRVLRGRMKVSTSVRVCAGFGRPDSLCAITPGRIEFSEPVPKNAGLLVQGVLWYQGKALPFAATLKDGRFPQRSR